MIEVEIKLPLFRRSVTERTLTAFGFKPGNLVKESDFYFTSDFHDFMKTDEHFAYEHAITLTQEKQLLSSPIKGRSLILFPQQEKNWKPA